MTKLRLPKLSRKNILPLALVAAFVFVLLSAGGFAFAASQEENDSFCASCHTQPETTYYQRSLDAAAVDLASAHRQESTRCIDCHSGMGVIGRVSAELMGAQNAFKWYTGTASQPAPLLYLIGDNNCLKCHADVLTEKHDIDSRTVNFGPKGHYHTYLTQWKEADSNAAACTDCHFGHELGSVSENSWVIPASVQRDCEACHALMGSN
jgi:hypothetical protein